MIYGKKNLWTKFIFACSLKISSNFMHPFHEILQVCEIKKKKFKYGLLRKSM